MGHCKCLEFDEPCTASSLITHRYRFRTRVYSLKNFPSFILYLYTRGIAESSHTSRQCAPAKKHRRGAASKISRRRSEKIKEELARSCGPGEIPFRCVALFLSLSLSTAIFMRASAKPSPARPRSLYLTRGPASALVRIANGPRGRARRVYFANECFPIIGPSGDCSVGPSVSCFPPRVRQSLFLPRARALYFFVRRVLALRPHARRNNWRLVGADAFGAAGGLASKKISMFSLMR